MRLRSLSLAILMSSVAFTGASWAQKVIYRVTPHVVTAGSETPANPGTALEARDLSLQLRAGVPVSGRVAASGGVAPYAFSLSTGAPAWLTVDTGTGALSGTPPTGSWNASVEVRDGKGAVAVADLTVAVAGPLTASLAEILIEPGKDVFSVPSVNGGLAPYAFAWDTGSGPRPGWLKLDPSTGALSGKAERGSWDDLLLEVSDRDAGERFLLPVDLTVEAKASFQLQRLGGTGADYATGVAALSGGGVAITGYTNSPGGAGGDDAFVATYDSAGTLLWRRTLGGTGNDVARGIAALPNGGVAITGYTDSPGNAGNVDAFVATYDSSGTLLWRRALGGTGTDLAQGIATLPSGAVAITGYTDSPGNAGSPDAFVAFYDSSGTLLWRRALGKNGHDRAMGITALPGGGVAITGHTTSPGGPGNWDTFVAAYDSSGRFLWRRTLGGTGNDFAHGIVALPDGGVTITGATDSPGNAGGYDAFVAAYDSSGNFLWHQALSGTGDDLAHGITALQGGGVMIVGYTSSSGGAGGIDAFVAAYDSSGVLLWRRALGGTGADLARGIAALPGGGVAVAGNTTSPGGAGGSDAFVARFTEAGPNIGTFGSFTVSDMPSLGQRTVTMRTDLNVPMDTGRTITMNENRTVDLREPVVPMTETKDVGF